MARDQARHRLTIMTAIGSRVVALSIALSFSAGALAAPSQGDWPNYGRDPGAMRFSPLTQINPANVSTLKRAWTYQMPPPGVRMEVGVGFGAARPRLAENAAPEAAEAAAAAGPRRFFLQSEVTPIVAGGLMVVSPPYGRVVALDPVTGKEIWSYLAQGPLRGLAYWPGNKAHGARVIFP